MTARRVKKRVSRKSSTKAKTPTRSVNTTTKKPVVRTKKTPVKKPSQPGHLALWWESLGHDGRRRFGLGVIHVLLVALVLVLAAGGLYRMDSWLRSENSGVLADGTVAYIELESTPDWMPQWLSQAIRNELASHATIESYDKQLAERVGRRAEMCPWIARLDSVSLSFPDLGGDNSSAGGCRAVVRAVYRYPFAIAQNESVESFVDFFGFGLPHEQAAAFMSSIHMPRVFGVRAMPPRPGSPWRGRDVTAALALIERLSEKPYFKEIAAIDMGNFNFRMDRSASQVLISAVNGAYVTEIRFGSLPVGDVPPPGEPTLDQKLENLDSWYSLNDSSLTGPGSLDLRYPNAVRYPAEYDAARR